MAIPARGRDVPRWLSGTVYIVDAPAEGECPLHFYRGCDDDMVGGENVLTLERSLHPVNEISTWWPTLGAVNYASHAIHLSRTAQRQWKRSYCSKQVSATVPGEAYYPNRTGFSGRQYANDPGVLLSLYNKQFPELNLAVARLDEPGMHSIAVSPRLIIVNHGTSGERGLYYNGELVGDFRADGERYRVNMHKLGSIADRIAKFFGEDVEVV